MRHSLLAGLALTSGCGAGALAAPAWAAETITYKYDARGRLTAVVRTGTAHPGAGAGGVVTSYGHDKAGNRTAKVTTGSPNPPPP